MTTYVPVSRATSQMMAISGPGTRTDARTSFSNQALPVTGSVIQFQ
jgi:hypothetical protein